MGCIYIIKNTINDKVYIGQTIHTVEYRFREHLRDAYAGVDRKLYNAMRELGIENFYAEKLVDCKDEVLNDEEVRFITIYDSFINGYNSTSGGSTGAHKYDLDHIRELANRGLSKKEIMQEINVRKEYLCKLHDFSDTNIKTSCNKKALDMYDIKREFIKSFESIIEAYEYICNYYGYIIDKRNFYNRVNQSCLIGSIAYNHVWRYKNKQFTSFDRDTYKEKIDIRCQICNEIIEKGRVCRECYDKYLSYYEGLQLTEHKIPDRIKIICNVHKCKNSKCNRETYYDNEYCTSCKNVMRLGKIEKPSREEFINMINSGMTLKDIALKYGRNHSTVSVWKKQYMSDISESNDSKEKLLDETLLELINKGLSIRQIAQICDRSAGTIQYRLSKLGIGGNSSKTIVCETTGKEFGTYKEAGEHMKTLYPYTMDAKYVGNEIRKSIENNTMLHDVKWKLK